jgi:PKD repeat protein
MSKKTALAVTVIVLVMLMLVLKYYDVITLRQLALITEKRRYMRNDKKLLTEPTVLQESVSVSFTYWEELSSVLAVITIDIEGKEYACVPELTAGTYYANLSVNVANQQLYNNYLMVTFKITVYNLREGELPKEIYTGILETFTTEEMSYDLSLAESSWTIRFFYNFDVYDYSFEFDFFYGDDNSYIDGITFYIAEPKADFVYTPTVVYEGDEVLFNASVSENATKIIKYEWAIKEGSTIIYQTTTTTPEMFYTFTKPTVFSVQLKITDELNQTSSITKDIEVLELLSVDFSYSGKLYTYEFLTFQAIVTSKYEIQKYTWNFGDGNITETTVDNVKHFYQNSGQFKVTFTVVDVQGNKDTTSKTLNIAESTYKISVSTSEVLRNEETKIGVNIIKNGEPYAYANIKLLSKDFSFTTQTNTLGNAVFFMTFTERGTYTVEVIDSDYNVIIGNFNIFCTVKPLLETEYEEQQFYNLIGENDFSITVILLDPDTFSPVMDYEPSVFLVSEGVEIPNEIYREDNRFVVTAKVFNTFNDTKERLINIYIKITSDTYYDTLYNTTVKMIQPVVDYWICDLEGNPLPANLKTGTRGFAVKLIKPEYMNISKDNIYIEIRSPTGIITSNNLSLNIVGDYVYVDYVFEEEGVYEVVVSIINLPLFIPTRTYIYTVQELTALDYASKYLQYIFIVAVILTALLLYLWRQREA